MFTTLSSAAVLVLSMLVAQPDAPSEPSERPVEIFDQTLEIDGQQYAWSIMIPPTAEKGGRSLLFLHGYGECGTDGEKQLTVGLPAAIEKNPDRWPFVVIVPQKPTHNSEWENHEEAVLAMIEQATEMGFIDPERLAITGLSQGGHGAIALAAAHPEMFAAAAPVCGYVEPRFREGEMGDRSTRAMHSSPGVVAAAEKLKEMPVWLFHGRDDTIVPVDESRALHMALTKLDAPVKYTEVPDTGHNSWDAAYRDADLALWLRKHTE